MAWPATITPSITLERLVAHASSAGLQRRVLDVFERLESDVYLEKSKARLRQAHSGQSRFMPAKPVDPGRHPAARVGLSGAGGRNGSDGYWDLCCVLAAIAEFCRPRRYLEIGVRRGRSACVVAAFCRDVDLYLFDTWVPNYAGVPNPGPDFVRSELSKVGHRAEPGSSPLCRRGTTTIIEGRSQHTVPAFLASSSPDLRFELITVDGDHSDDGARADLENVVPRLAPGGLLVFDDIAHPDHPGLGDVWRDWAARHSDLVTAAATDHATGTAVAFRRPAPSGGRVTTSGS